MSNKNGIDSAARTARLHPATPHRKPYRRGNVPCDCGGVPQPQTSHAASAAKRRAPRRTLVRMAGPRDGDDYARLSLDGRDHTTCIESARATACGVPGRVLCHDDTTFECHPCPSCGANSGAARGCPTCDRQTRTVRVLFSVEIDVPVNNPNTMQLGPGPVLFGFCEEAMNEQLSNAPGWLKPEDAPWADAIGPFKLHAVEEVRP